jgi:hypothetical protein
VSAVRAETRTGLTGRNQLARPTPEGEPQRIALLRHIDYLYVRTRICELLVTLHGMSSERTHARLVEVRAELGRLQSVGHESVTVLGRQHVSIDHLLLDSAPIRVTQRRCRVRASDTIVLHEVGARRAPEVLRSLNGFLNIGGRRKIVDGIRENQREGKNTEQVSDRAQG